MDVDNKRMAADDCGLLLVGINADGRLGVGVAIFVVVRFEAAIEGPNVDGGCFSLTCLAKSVV